MALCTLVLPFIARLALPLVPLPAGLLAPNTERMEFLDRDGRSLRETPDSRSCYSTPVPYREIPQCLIQATLAAEDKRFWSHHGVDWRATFRAALALLRHGRVVSGGSTITQQLIKLAEPRPRSFRTKLIESAQALRLEQLWSKERILTEYLDRVDYGNLRAGCGGASEHYFHKPLGDLSPAEAALLAGLPQAPSRLNPRLHPERARKRQRWILERMLQENLLTAEAFNRASQEPLQLAPPTRVFQAPHFIDLVMQSQRAGDAGLKSVEQHAHWIQTTLDLPLNQFAERTLRDHLARLQSTAGASSRSINGAIVIIENRTGDVLALVGSEDYFAPGSGQVNGAFSPRSTGSTLKPFTYLLAFEQGATPATMVADVPIEFPTATGIFRPVNYNHRCYGPMRYRLALANSLNISAVKVLASAGGPGVLLERLRRCGVTTLTNSAEFYGLGLTIGNSETRLLELANAYACLARLGSYKPYRLLHPTDFSNDAACQPIFDPAAAYLIADILNDNSARALAFGIDSDLRFDFPVACKTGTSSDFRDNWAIGYTPEFTVGVWVGRFDGAPMEHISGVGGAAPVLHDLFVHLRHAKGTGWYARPTNVVERLVHPLTGKLVAEGKHGEILEKFISGRFPAPEAAGDIDPGGRVRLSPEYGDWFQSGDNWLSDKAILQEAQASTSLKVIQPLPGTTYYLDPDLPRSSRRILLKATGRGALSWESDSLACQRERGETFAILVEGQHRVRVRDSALGVVVETWIIVKAL